LSTSSDNTHDRPTARIVSQHRIQFLHIDRTSVAEQYDEYRKTDRRLSGSNGENKENEHLPGVITQMAGKSDEVEVHSEQHQFNAHEQQYQVASINDDPRNAQHEQHCRYRQIML